MGLYPASLLTSGLSGFPSSTRPAHRRCTGAFTGRFVVFPSIPGARRWFVQAAQRGGPTTTQSRRPQYTQTSRRIRTRPVVTRSDCNGANNLRQPLMTLPTCRPFMRYVIVNGQVYCRGIFSSSRRSASHPARRAGVGRMHGPRSRHFPHDAGRYRPGFGADCSDEV